MRELRLPLTRETYLNLAHLGDVPNPYPAELEAMLPPQFRIK